jgi:hypothetical protein
MGRRARPPQRTPARFRPLNERAPGRGFREKLPEPGALVPDQTTSGHREAHPSASDTPLWPRRLRVGAEHLYSDGPDRLSNPDLAGGHAAQPRHLPEKLRRLRALPLHLSRAPRRTRQVFPDLLLSVRGRQAHRDLMTLSGFRARRVSSAPGTGHRDRSAGKGAFVPAPHPPESRRRVVDLARLRLKPIAAIAKTRRARPSTERARAAAALRLRRRATRSSSV